MGVSIEIGSLAIFMIRRILSSGISMSSERRRLSGSTPVSWSSWRVMRFMRLIVSIMWTGMRIVLAWSAMLRVMAWRIHQVA